jgi:trigger factor
MPVQVEQERLDHCRVALTISVPPEEIQKAISSVFNQFAKRTSVPGFRPGKAPRHLIKRFVDESRVRELALDQALNDAYRQAVRDAHVQPLQDAEPQVEFPEGEMNLEEGFSFKATVPLEPVVELGDLDGLSARRVTTKIADEDVERELTRLRESAARFAPTDAAAEEGHRVRATVEVTVDGQPVPDASFEEPTLIQIGTNLEGFDAGLKGLHAGEEKTYEFQFPEDFADEDLQGKTGVAHVKATDVLARQIPELDEEFAKEAGFESVEAVRERVRQSLQTQADVMADQEVNDSLIREVVRRATVHFPDEMLDREVSDRVRTLITALERRGLTLEDYLEETKNDVATLQSNFREEARETLVNTLVLLELARQEKLLITEREIEEEIKRRAEAEGVKLSQMRRLLNETGEMAGVQNRVFIRKITEFLRSKAQIQELEA